MIFGTIGIFVRSILLPSAEIALFRVVIGAFIVGGYLLITKQGFGLSAMREVWYFLLPSGAVLGINWIFLFEAYRYTTVSIATLSYYFAPILVTLLCPLFFKEKTTPRQLLCFVGATMGLVLCTGIGNTSEKPENLLGVTLGLIAAILYASIVLLNKRLATVPGTQRTFWQFIIAALVLIPYVLCTDGISAHRLNTGGMIALLLVGIIHSGIAYCLYFASISQIKGQQVALLSYVDPLTAVVLSVTVLGEPLSLPQAIGGGMILLFTLLAEIPLKSKKIRRN